MGLADYPFPQENIACEKHIVIDAVGALARDAAARVVGAYQAGAYEASSSHFQRFMSLWSNALSRNAEGN